MKVCINSKLLKGPFGGGMQFANYLSKYLKSRNIGVVNDLSSNDIDIILHVSPFPFLTVASSFSFLEAKAYKYCHPNTIIIHRINECDERKKTNYINKLLIKVGNTSDFQVYISNWLKQLLVKAGMNNKIPSSVILNGADEKIFNTKYHQSWDGQSPLKIVTHHWSGHYAKGHDIYHQLDQLLGSDAYRKKFELTIIGNIPKNLEYRNTNIIPPLSGLELSKALQNNHIYLTASRNEPAGMHHIEGAMCGLPLLYINSGALPEYCQNFGLEFRTNNFEQKLQELRHSYYFWHEKIKHYPHTAKAMAEQYLILFQELTDYLPASNKGSHLKGVLFKFYSLYYNTYWKMKKLILTYD